MMVGTNNHSHAVVRRIPVNSVGAEIGVWKGDTSAKFLTKKLKSLHLVDSWSMATWFDYLDEDQQKETLLKYSRALNIPATREALENYYDFVYESVLSRFRSYPNVTIHRKDSKDWFNETGPILDWIYVDGDHSYEGCLRDLEASLSVLKKDGVIFGDDYGNKKGVKDAVDKFVEIHNFDLEVFEKNQFRIVR